MARKTKIQKGQQPLTKSQVNELLLITIFGKGKDLSCDCDGCKYEAVCEMDNPDFDANYCRVA